MARELSLSLSAPTVELIHEIRNSREDVSFATVEHAVGPTDTNLIQLARERPDTKSILMELASAGFYLYRTLEHGSRLVRDHTIPSLWHSVRNGTFDSTDDGLIYKYTPPLISTSRTGLIVVFSSMSRNLFTSSLMRYFEQNYRSIQKYVPHNTAVLRIADIGGVVGSFYLDTIRRPDNSKSIQGLIAEIQAEHGIEAANTTLYGASKGGTGALYHGLETGLSAVVVDPIVSDDFYESQYNDSHFTAGPIFPHSKQEVFSRILDARRMDRSSHLEDPTISIISSPNSPQYSYLKSAIFRENVSFSIFDSSHPAITDHPDVSPNTLNIVTMLMNMNLYGLEIPKGTIRALA